MLLYVVLFCYPMSMKKLTFLFTLLMSAVMFSSPSYSEWTKVSTSVGGDTFYVDFDRIRKNRGYTYFWNLSNYLKPNPYGDFSGILYYQSDCGVLRYKVLSDSYFKGGPEIHMTKHFLVPFVTGNAWCLIKDGNIIISPLSLCGVSVHSSVPPGCSTCKPPPSKSSGSVS